MKNLSLNFALLLLPQVPNIRFNVAAELATIAPVCGRSTYESQFVPVLSMLREDEDADVRFNAEKTSKSLEASFTNIPTSD